MREGSGTRVTEIPPLFRPSHHVELLAFSPDGKAIALSEAIRGRVEIVNIESRTQAPF